MSDGNGQSCIDWDEKKFQIVLKKCRYGYTCKPGALPGNFKSIWHC